MINTFCILTKTVLLSQGNKIFFNIFFKELFGSELHIYHYDHLKLIFMWGMRNGLQFISNCPATSALKDFAMSFSWLKPSICHMCVYFWNSRSLPLIFCLTYFKIYNLDCHSFLGHKFYEFFQIIFRLTLHFYKF